MEDLSQEAQYQLMKGWLNERQWRLYVATEAKRIGVGGISQVAREAGVTRKTIRKGIRELEAGARYQPGERLRKPGGGRKKVTEKDVGYEPIWKRCWSRREIRRAWSDGRASR